MQLKDQMNADNLNIDPVMMIDGRGMDRRLAILWKTEDALVAFASDVDALGHVV